MLGERICQLRTEKNLSQADLADALQVSRQSISKWETNGSVPELDKLIKLSRIFGVTMDELVTGEKRDIAEEAPASQPEPQVIYIEKPVKATMTAAQIFGVILLSCGLLSIVLFACFGKRYDFPEVIALCAPVVLWGLLCLLTKNPLLWCGWCGCLTWWIYMFVMAARWEEAVLHLLVGILLTVVALGYTVYLHKKERIHVPAWGWALLTVALGFGALLLIVNLLPPAAGSIARPSEITGIAPPVQ